MHRIKKSQLIIWAIMVLTTLTLFSGCEDNESNSQNNREPIRSAGNSAPDFNATTIDGEKISLSDFNGKKAVLVDIWATWCPPCKKEMPELQKLYDKYSDKMEIIAVSVDKPTDLPKIKQFVSQNNITFKIVHDKDKSISAKYPTRSIPYLVVISKDGNIVRKFTGFSDNVPSLIEKALDL